MPSSGCKKCALDRKSTRLNSSHTIISYAVFCLEKDARGGGGAGGGGGGGGRRPARGGWRGRRQAVRPAAGGLSARRAAALSPTFLFFLKLARPPDTPPPSPAGPLSP